MYQVAAHGVPWVCVDTLTTPGWDDLASGIIDAMAVSLACDEASISIVSYKGIASNGQLVG
jgi:hypothetical protein